MTKESYFTPETIKHKALEMHLDYAQQRQRENVPFVPERSALLVLDMQAVFLDEISHAYVPSAKAILPGLKKLVRAYAERGLPLFFTRHVNTPGDDGVMASWWQDLIRAGDSLSEITPELDLSLGTVIQKGQYDAFYQTELQEMLLKRGATQVVIGGVMTHLCCETTARGAFTRGLEVFFLLDGTATYNEAYHRATLLNLAHGFAVLMRSDDILERVERAPHA